MSLCRDCQLYDLAAVLSKNGRVLTSRAAQCLWVSTEPLPKSVRAAYQHMARASVFMEPNDGEECPCFKPRTPAPECPNSPDGLHQVDTSMEEGPSNCFHCGTKMR